MSKRFLASLGILAVVIAVVSLAAVPVVGQTPSAKATAAGTTWKLPRTADGQPDLQGVWSNNSVTPLERPPAFAGKTVLTDKEVAELKKKAAELLDNLQAGDIIGDSLIRRATNDPNYRSFDEITGNYNSFWIVDREWGDNRTSLITDPADGRIPPLTQEAQKRLAAAAQSRMLQLNPDSYEDLSLGHRCISFGSPRLGAGYNSYYQIFQSRDYVVFQMEMAHDARVIPLDGRSHVPQNIRQWLGDARGHWEGNTLVVETTNYPTKGNFMGSTENLKTIERFTRVGPNTLNYEVTINDPTTWTKPWTAMIPLKQSEDKMYEYACHEGNESVEGALSGARAKEKAAQEAAKKGSN